MKIAIAVDTAEESARVSEHFGRARYFLIYNVANESVSFVEARANPKAQGHGHFHEAILPVLEDVEVVISAGIGRSAYSHLIAEDKKVIVTGAIPAGEAAEKFAKGELKHEPERIHSGHHHHHSHAHHSH